jgi:RNA polymerase sigma-70 factor (ECF subfamily)
MSTVIDSTAVTVTRKPEGVFFPNSSEAEDDRVGSSPSPAEGWRNCFGAGMLGTGSGMSDEPNRLEDSPTVVGDMPNGRSAEATSAVRQQPSPFPQQPSIPQSPGEALLDGFDALFHAYQRRVYRQCYRMVGNPEDAEDLTQEVFLQVFRKAHTFRGEASFSTWLHRLTINTVLMRLRRQRRWRATVTSFDAAPAADHGPREMPDNTRSIPAQARYGTDTIDLNFAITQLPTGYKEILLMHDLEGYRHDEIARLLGISEGTSKSQLHKARIRVRALMDRTDGVICSGHVGPGVGYLRRKRSPARRAVAYACA